MRTKKTLALTTVAATAMLGVSACSSESADDAAQETGETMVDSTDHTAHTDHAEHEGHGAHDHPEDGGPAPAGIAEAENPTYPVGTEVILTADHMPGMDGAEATISGAFNTTTYAVSYTPTDGGQPVENHKWVVHEELANVDKQKLQPGDTATIEAEHMSGMQGAEATIDSATEETVYMVDIDSPDMTMKRHKWVVESEIQPK